jgi:hypothetical protein
MTLLWFIVFSIMSLVGTPESLTFAPLNAWAWLLLAAVAYDLLNRGSSNN